MNNSVKLKTKSAMSKKLKKILLYTVATLLGIQFLIPLYLAIVNSLRDPYTTPTFFPRETLWKNYYTAVTLIPFFKYLMNSVIIVVIVVSLAVVMNFMMGYAFARLKAPGKNTLFKIVLSTMLIPGLATQIPQYILFQNMGLRNTYWIYILGGLGGSAFNIFLFRQFFSSMPKELEDAAKIDGCSVVGTMIRIFAPSALPVITIIAIWAFQAAWGDFMTPFMFFETDKYPLAMALFGLDYQMPGKTGMKVDAFINAAAVLMMIPSLLVFFGGQKHIVEGVVTSGIKG